MDRRQFVKWLVSGAAAAAAPVPAGAWLADEKAVAGIHPFDPQATYGNYGLLDQAVFDAVAEGNTKPMEAAIDVILKNARLALPQGTPFQISVKRPPKAVFSMAPDGVDTDFGSIAWKYTPRIAAGKANVYVA